MSTPTDPNGPDGEYLTGRANVRSDPGRASLLMQVPRVPKKEGAINPINRAMSWRCSLSPRENIEHFSLNS